jgi:predicted DNA-binding transcriptional regulator AlpA
MTSHAVPGWPEGLTEVLAAAYLGVSVSLFRREWEAGRMPKPRRITPGRQIWHRRQLQAWLDAQFDLENHPAVAPGPSLVDEWDQACGASEPALP